MKIMKVIEIHSKKILDIKNMKKKVYQNLIQNLIPEKKNELELQEKT